MKLILNIIFFWITSFSFAQNLPATKYQGLLWEISGKGLKKPSYLFGTMHVSSKVAFHLGDAFYTSIKNADVVALETNPDEMLDDYMQSIFLKIRAEQQQSTRSTLSRRAFTVSNYRDLLQLALSYDPEMLNQLLYRSYMAMEDFEENTFLDLYIYQVGKRLGKRAAGVENFRESEQLVLEALHEMAEELKNKKTRSDIDEDDHRVRQPVTLTDAYRSGNLDLLDSLARKQYRSDAFLEKFLYKRNENMFHAIDSIVQQSSLFAGVGAAHLPGNRGLISLLRKAGYTVKPLKMGERDSEQKEQIEKIRVARTFTTQTAEDGWYQVDMPGKLYDFSNQNPLMQRQYADLANGAYYAVSRVKTNALLLGQTPDQVLAHVDSLLYEHIPGKIISKTAVSKNGYHGYDIRNRSRRGDMQRYQILVTPFEVFVFKMSGNDNYVDGKEADRFFSSIRLKELAVTSWQPFTPVTGGFKVKFPHTPVSSTGIESGQGHSWDAWDKTTGNSYKLMCQTVAGALQLEEDTTELSIMEESFLESDFIKKPLTRKLLTYKGYSYLEVSSKTKDDSYNLTRFVLKGPHYYVLSASYNKDRKSVQSFFDSFSFQDFQYPELVDYKDTTLRFMVKIPAGSEPGEGEKLKNLYGEYVPETAQKDENYRVVHKTLTFTAPNSGETVLLSYQQFPKYYSYTNQKRFWEEQLQGITHGKIVFRQEQKPAGDAQTCYVVLRDTNSSRSLLYKMILRNRILYTLAAATDTLYEQTAFTKTILDSFVPTGLPIGKSVHVSKADEFLTELASKNAETRQKAKEAVRYVEFLDSDAPRLISMLQKLNPKEKGYLDSKRLLIGQLGTTKHPQVIPYLKNMYLSTNDTTTLQYAILNALIRQKTPESYAAFKEIVLSETPVFTAKSDIYGLFYPLRDSLALAASLLPDLLKLASLSDYKDPVYGLLTALADSSYVTPAAYEPYLSQIIYDARIESKRQFAQEEERQIAEEAKDQTEVDFDYDGLSANSSLIDFATLLVPHLGKNKNTDRFFDRILQSSDQTLLVEIVGILLKNKQTVADSLLLVLAASNQHRAPLYYKLRSVGRLDRFPKKYNSQEAIARSLLYQQETYNSQTDTIQYLNRQVTGYNLKRGYVYFYKYKKPDTDDWYIAISGLQPLNGKQIDTDATLVRLTDKKIRKDKTVSEQLARTLREMKLEGRREELPSVSPFLD